MHIKKSRYDGMPDFDGFGCEMDFRRWCYGKGNGGQPAPPDPAATAAAQAAANKEAVYESARVNQINQVGPQGTVTYSGEIGSPDRTQTTALNPQAQNIFNNQQGIAGDLTQFASEYVPRVADGLSTPFNTGDLGMQAPQANPEERQRIEQGLMDRLNPQFDRDQAALQSRLANQGIGVGSEAYTDAQGDFDAAKTDARFAAINQAGNEYSRDFGLQSSAYNQQLSDALLNRTQGLNEVSALLQGSPAISQPQAAATSQYQIAPGDIQGASALNYQGQLNNYNQRVGQQNAMMGGLASLGGAAIMASDRRVKTNSKRVGATDDGLPIYTYRYTGGGPVQMGVMAQEVAEVNPAAVHDIGGMLAVNYGAL